MDSSNKPIRLATITITGGELLAHEASTAQAAAVCLIEQKLREQKVPVRPSVYLTVAEWFNSQEHLRLRKETREPWSNVTTMVVEVHDFA